MRVTSTGRMARSEFRTLGPMKLSSCSFFQIHAYPHLHERLGADRSPDLYSALNLVKERPCRVLLASSSHPNSPWPLPSFLQAPCVALCLPRFPPCILDVAIQDHSRGTRQGPTSLREGTLPFGQNCKTGELKMRTFFPRFQRCS